MSSWPGAGSPRCPRLRKAFAFVLGVATLLLPLAFVGCNAPGTREPARIRNVVLVSLDTMGALHSSAYGYDRPTSPELEALAARGVLFEHAYTQQVWTLTAHISLVTGLNPQVHRASQRLAATPAAPTLAELLSSAGFATAAFTGGGGYMNPRFGLGRGFERYELGQEDAAKDSRSTLAWLEQQAALATEDEEHRFFLFAHYFDAHSDVGTELPYQVPAPYGGRFTSEVLAQGEAWGRRGDTELLLELERSGDVSERDRDVIAAQYDEGVLHTDRVGLGALLAKLEELGLMRETLVIVTADHGEEIFEHGKSSHQQPYEEIARIPLVFVGPRIREGVRLDSLVELIDIMPTILSLTRLEVPSHVQGRDLSSLLVGAGEVEGPGAALAGDAHVDGILGGLPHFKWRYPSSITRVIHGRRWSYVNTVRNKEQDGRREFFMLSDGELYLLDEDPGQQRNVHDENKLIAHTLKRALLAWYDENEALARDLQAREAPLDAKSRELPPLAPQERDELRALGYAE